MLDFGRYHDAKGFQVILVASLLKLVTLGFTVTFSGLLLLCINWQALHYPCILEDTCDLAEVRFCPSHTFTTGPTRHVQCRSN